MSGASLAPMTTNITKKTAVLASVVGLSLGGAALATAATTTSSPPSTSAPSPGTAAKPGPPGPGGPGGPAGHRGGPGHVDTAALAKVLGVTEAKVTAALDAQRQTKDDHDAAFAKAVADKLGVTQAQAQAALDSARTAVQDDETAALAKALGVDASKVKAALAAQHPKHP